MTRFARAKGSKASNERLPNEPTPWHVMKEQLEDNQHKKQQPTEKTKTAKQLLKEKETPFYYDTTGAINNDWAEFEDTTTRNETRNKKGEKKSKKITSLEENLNVSVETKHDTKVTDNKSTEKNKSSKRKINEINDEPVVETVIKKSKKLKTKAKGEIVASNAEANDIPKSDDKSKAQQTNKKNKNKMNKSVEDVNEKKRILPSKEETETDPPKDDTKSKNENENHERLTKRQKRNLKRKNKTTDDGNNDDALKTEGKAENGSQTVEDVNRLTVEQNAENSNNNRRDSQMFNRNPSNQPGRFNDNYNRFGKNNLGRPNKNNHTTPAKVRDDKEHKRRKPENGATKMMINGIEIVVVKYNGFPVKQEDAERLKDLKQQMIMKGIPKKEIDAAMKLERRKAEKALARLRKCVCFHCRKAGHNLSDCPELGSEQAATGICFKCGSTEHTHFECKVARAAEYRFATCFICREQGHIAKQCPDNPKGVYPQGGACKICGDVTHLKKDCPDLAKDREETSVTVDTIGNDTLEDLENAKKINEEKKDSKRIVKF